VGCYERHFALDWCLDHYVAHHHDVTREQALAIRAASGRTREVARTYGVSRWRVWEIRHGS
jgi:hypothetical protein